VLKQAAAGWREGERAVLEKWRERWPDLALAALVLYVCLLGFATLDELLGWGLITPYFK
jgi:hypothetical protein